MAGHLFYQDENGEVWTNSKDLYRGIPGAIYIWHGEWADAEIYYRGHLINVNDPEDWFWSDFCEETPGEKHDSDNYENWLTEQGPEYITGILDELVFNLEYNEN